MCKINRKQDLIDTNPKRFLCLLDHQKMSKSPDLSVVYLWHIATPNSPGRAAPVGRCDVAYTPRWALHKAVAGHRRGRHLALLEDYLVGLGDFL